MKKKNIARLFKRLKIYFLLDFIRKIRFFLYRFHHPYLKLRYQPGHVTFKAQNNIKNLEFIRHLKAVKFAIDHPLTSQWKDIAENHHFEVIQYLRNANYLDVERMVADPLSNDLMYGFDNLAKSLKSKLRLETRSENALTADHFLALAEYFGIVKYQGPEGLVSRRKKLSILIPL